jgi:hypothetical protein
LRTENAAPVGTARCAVPVAERMRQATEPNHAHRPTHQRAGFGCGTKFFPGLCLALQGRRKALLLAKLAAWLRFLHQRPQEHPLKTFCLTPLPCVVRKTALRSSVT